MTMLKVGIADMYERRERMTRIIRGELPREPNAPKLWFTTVDSFVKTLSTGHREFLREIAETYVSVTLDELSRVTGRKKTDFGGMLIKLAEMGHIEVHLREGGRLRSKVVDGRITFVAPPSEQVSELNSQGGCTKHIRDDSIGRKRRIATG